MSNRFNLETALAAWRRPYERDRTFSAEDLEELEAGLRDRVRALVEVGLPEEEAFRMAVRRVGSYAVAETEYRKVYWGKLKRERRITDELIWRGSMLKNYFKVAVRNLLRQKSYSLLNIVGLSVGLACAFLIVLWIQDELSYDRFHEDGDRIYRVMRHVHSGDEIRTSNTVAWNLAGVLEQQYPEIEDIALITTPRNFIFTVGDVSARAYGFYATSNFFNLFSWNLVQGDPAMVLQDPTSIVISASLAEKYFGSDWRNRAVGGILHHTVEDLPDFTVAGVFEDPPDQSSLRFDFVLPIDEFERRNEWWIGNWNNSGFRIFVRMQEGEDGAALSEKITDLQNDHIDGFRSDIFLQRYTDQHLYSSFRDGVQTGGQIEYIRIFAAIAFMILLIACINFMNLATARSMRRAREVGVRKAIGAGRQSLVGQFMGESLLLVILAFVLAIGLIVAALPAFNILTGKALAISGLGGSLWVFAGMGVLTALLAGLYPALYLSSFDAVKILRGTFHMSGASVRLRKGLVVFQFAMSILLIVGTVTVYQQIDFIYSMHLGLDRENVVYMRLEGEMDEQFNTFKEELLRNPGIGFVTAASSSPLDVNMNTHSVTWPGKNPDQEISMNILSVDFDFLDVMTMDLATGRDFDPSFGTDSVNYIINETAREVMGFESPVGEHLSFWGDTGAIVGVVRDFNMSSLYSEIEPTIIRLRPQETQWLFLRTEPGQTREALATLEAVYDRFNASYPFEYGFLDEQFRETYQSETVVGKLVGYFAAFALFIAALGLFGLAAFTAQQRTKEIGVRKVLGATVSNLVVLLSKGFVQLVIVAFILTTPLAYMLMSRWLDQFAYHIEISGWIFLGAGLAALLIALLAVSFQSVKAALADPVKSLRYE